MTENKGFVPRTFASSTELDSVEGDDGSVGFDLKSVGWKAWTTAGVGVLLLIFGVGSLGGSPEETVSESDQATIRQLHDDVAAVKEERASLPDAKSGDRDLVKALDAANDVADVQNSSRPMVKFVDDDGALDEDKASDVSGSMRPLIDPKGSSQRALSPWYFLDSDQKVPAGIGISETFGSGVEWQTQAPTLINADGSIDVTWLAVQTKTADDRDPEVLAWAEGTYDSTRQVFTDVRVGTTTTGAALEKKVNS